MIKKIFGLALEYVSASSKYKETEGELSRILSNLSDQDKVFAVSLLSFTRHSLAGVGLTRNRSQLTRFFPRIWSNPNLSHLIPNLPHINPNLWPETQVQRTVPPSAGTTVPLDDLDKIAISNSPISRLDLTEILPTSQPAPSSTSGLNHPNHHNLIQKCIPKLPQFKL